MFTYGYIREAALAHLDIDETEAEAMHLLQRFHLYANEAMLAICASKPMYQYIDVTVVDKFDPLVMSGSFLRPATAAEIAWNIEEQGTPNFVFANDVQTAAYYHERGIYEVREIIPMRDNFIAFANKQAFKIIEYMPSVAEQLEAELRGYTLPATGEQKVEARQELDFSYLGQNKLKFYKAGRYLIPGKFLWFRFDSGIGDTDEIEMPSDILLTIPLYIASICLQIDNMGKAQIMRQEFEMALARCTSTDFMPLNKIRSTW